MPPISTASTNATTPSTHTDPLPSKPNRPTLSVAASADWGTYVVKQGDTGSVVEQIQDVARTIYYFTGASTERQAVLAYNAFASELDAMGEKAVRETIINPIKRQEPGHFAFYRMSAEKVTTDGTLKPWQMWLARKLRTFSYELVGTHNDPRYQAQMGEVITKLGFERELEVFAKEIGRLEARLLWAQHEGLEFPPYVIKALRESVELYRERGAFTPNL